MRDLNGKDLAVGDRVTIAGTIKSLSEDEGATQHPYCNVEVETEIPINGKAFTMALNCGQIKKADEKADEKAD